MLSDFTRLGREAKSCCLTTS